MDLRNIEAVDELAPGELPAAAMHVAAIQARIAARMAEVRNVPLGTGTGASRTDRMLSTQEAAERLGVSVKWLYRHRGELPFARAMGRYRRYSEQGLERFIDRMPRE